MATLVPAARRGHLSAFVLFSSLSALLGNRSSANRWRDEFGQRALWLALRENTCGWPDILVWDWLLWRICGHRAQ
jgi:hypothetical protein